jgi:hypothetical protein
MTAELTGGKKQNCIATYNAIYFIVIMNDIS